MICLTSSNPTYLLLEGSKVECCASCRHHLVLLLFFSCADPRQGRVQISIPHTHTYDIPGTAVYVAKREGEYPSSFHDLRTTCVLEIEFFFMEAYIRWCYIRSFRYFFGIFRRHSFPRTAVALSAGREIAKGEVPCSVFEYRLCHTTRTKKKKLKPRSTFSELH